MPPISIVPRNVGQLRGGGLEHYLSPCNVDDVFMKSKEHIEKNALLQICTKSKAKGCSWKVFDEEVLQRRSSQITDGLDLTLG